LFGGHTDTVRFGEQKARRYLHRGIRPEGTALGEGRLQEIYPFDQTLLGRGSLEIHRGQDRPQIPLELNAQTIEMLPLKGRLVKTDLGHDVIGDLFQLFPLQNAESPGLQLMEGGVRGNVFVDEEVEHLGSLLQILVDFDPMGIDPVFGGGSGGIGPFADIEKEAGQQIVEMPLIPVMDEAQQVDTGDPGIKAFQSEDGIVRHQRGVILDAFIGNGQGG